MKKLVLMFALLFAFSSSFVSCRETANESTEAELNNEELNVNEGDEDLRGPLDNNPDESSTEVPREEGPGTIEDDL